jgi:hypothetical protein
MSKKRKAKKPTPEKPLFAVARIVTFTTANGTKKYARMSAMESADSPPPTAPIYFRNGVVMTREDMEAANRSGTLDDSLLFDTADEAMRDLRERGLTVRAAPNN